MQRQVNDMQEEWRHEYELESEETETESEESTSYESDTSEWSAQSAPATFSYKRQRVDAS